MTEKLIMKEKKKKIVMITLEGDDECEMVGSGRVQDGK